MEDAELKLRHKEIDLKTQELQLARIKAFIDFAKFGFSGTLTGAILGMVLVASLAILQATTDFKLETWGYIALALIIVLACIAYGYFSLWALPSIVGKFRDMEIGFAHDLRDNEKRD